MIYKILKFFGFRKCTICGKIKHRHLLIQRRLTDDAKDLIGYLTYVCKNCSANLDKKIIF